MEYTIYQLEFKTGVHFGTGMLNESACTFKADQIFSALYIEALKLNLQQQLYDAVKKGNLLISDAFPYIGQQYMIPKPMIYVEPVNRGESKQKKAYKKMKFIPVECLIDFLNGKMDLSNDPIFSADDGSCPHRGGDSAVPGWNILLWRGMWPVYHCRVSKRK